MPKVHVFRPSSITSGRGSIACPPFDPEFINLGPQESRVQQLMDHDGSREAGMLSGQRERTTYEFPGTTCAAAESEPAEQHGTPEPALARHFLTIETGAIERWAKERKRAGLVRWTRAGQRLKAGADRASRAVNTYSTSRHRFHLRRKRIE